MLPQSGQASPRRCGETKVTGREQYRVVGDFRVRPIITDHSWDFSLAPRDLISSHHTNSQAYQPTHLLRRTERFLSETWFVKTQSFPPLHLVSRAQATGSRLDCREVTDVAMNIRSNMWSPPGSLRTRIRLSAEARIGADSRNLGCAMVTWRQDSACFPIIWDAPDSKKGGCRPGSRTLYLGYQCSHEVGSLVIKTHRYNNQHRTGYIKHRA